MRKSDFHYDLPEHLIAQAPLPERTASRLLCLLEGGSLEDRGFRDLPSLLRPGDLLVLNDTRVIPARLHGRKATGGRIEILVERLLDERTLLVHLRASKSPKPDTWLHLDGGYECRVLERREDLLVLEFAAGISAPEVLETVGHVPLPPYIQRPDTTADHHRYQTVFARSAGAVAAPTAGLHFDEILLRDLAGQGIDHVCVTLHVGSGTFLPVRVDDLDQHRMHAERCSVPETVVRRIRAARASGGRVIAVGTTVVRALETAARSGELEPYEGETRLFIRPGFDFRCVDVLLTNFHLPESTLLTLVCAFSGHAPVMAAYRHAVREGYRFFSYGDAMFLIREEAGRDAR